jgi:hypothetical protein
VVDDELLGANRIELHASPDGAFKDALAGRSRDAAEYPQKRRGLSSLPADERMELDHRWSDHLQERTEYQVCVIAYCRPIEGSVTLVLAGYPFAVAEPSSSEAPSLILLQDGVLSPTR